MLLPSYPSYYAEPVKCVTKGETLNSWLILVSKTDVLLLLEEIFYILFYCWHRNACYGSRLQGLHLHVGWCLCPCLDCRLRKPADGGCVHSAALAGRPGEHGAQQSQPVSSSGSGDHRGTAHRAPASVSTHTRTGASCTLIWEEWLTSELWSNKWLKMENCCQCQKLKAVLIIIIWSKPNSNGADSLYVLLSRKKQSQ